MLASPETQNGLPDMKVSVRQVFGFDSSLEVPAYSQTEEHVPDGSATTAKYNSADPHKGHDHTFFIQHSRDVFADQA